MNGEPLALKLDDVIVPGQRLRAIRPMVVSQLAASIAEVGLLNPISVTPGGELVAGQHRLEACRSLGWAAIPATVVAVDDALKLRLAEVDENLVRADLTALEHAEHVTERKRVYELLHPDAPTGAGRPKNGETVSPFSTDTAAKTGQSERSVQLDVQVGNLPADVRDAIRGTPVADRKRDLIDLARMEPVEQAAVAEAVRNGAPTVAAAVELTSPPAPVEEAGRADLAPETGGDPDTDPDTGKPDPVALAREAVSNLAPDQLRQVLADRDPREVRAAVRTPRRENDAYYTPAVVAEFCITCLGRIRRGAQVLEPNVGGGAWARAAAATVVMDKDENAPGLVTHGNAEAIAADFLTHDFGDERFDFIVGNPPYDDAEAHVRRALSLLAVGGKLGFLLRRNFAGPARYDLFQHHAPEREIVLAPRISFTDDGGTDSQEYSFFVWGSMPTGDKPWSTRIMRWRRPQTSAVTP